MTHDDLMHVATAIQDARRSWTLGGTVPLTPSVRQAFDSITTTLWVTLATVGHDVSLSEFHAATNLPAPDTGERPPHAEPAEFIERPPLVDEFRGGRHTAARLREMARDQRTPNPTVSGTALPIDYPVLWCRIMEAGQVLPRVVRQEPDACFFEVPNDPAIHDEIRFPDRSSLRFGQNGDPA